MSDPSGPLSSDETRHVGWTGRPGEASRNTPLLRLVVLIAALAVLAVGSANLVTRPGQSALVITVLESNGKTVELDGQVLTGAVAIFVVARTNAKPDTVTYYVDGREVSLATQAPWRLVTSAESTTFDVSALGNGKHVVKAVAMRGGSEYSTSATFRVGQKSSAHSLPVVPSGPFNPLTFDYGSVGKHCERPSESQIRDGKEQLVVKGCTLYPKQGAGISYSAPFVAEFDNITSNKDGFNPVGPGPNVIAYNWIHRDGSTYIKPDGTREHHDGIQFWTGGNTTIRGNRIEGWNNSAIIVKSDIGPISHVTIDSNYLSNENGYYILYLYDGGHGFPTYVTVTNNVFAKKKFFMATRPRPTFVHTEAQRQAAIDAGNAAAAGWVVWDNNHFLDGSLVVPPGGWLE